MTAVSGLWSRLVPLGEDVAPTAAGPRPAGWVYVQLCTGEQVGISDANDAVGLLAQVHPHPRP